MITFQRSENMKITPQYISEMAKLSHLKLTETEKNDYAKELDKVFDYIDKLLDVSTDEVEVTSLMHILQDIRFEG